MIASIKEILDKYSPRYLAVLCINRKHQLLSGSKCTANILIAELMHQLSMDFYNMELKGDKYEISKSQILKVWDKLGCKGLNFTETVGRKKFEDIGYEDWIPFDILVNKIRIWESDVDLMKVGLTNAIKRNNALSCEEVVKCMTVSILENELSKYEKDNDNFNLGFKVWRLLLRRGVIEADFNYPTT